MVHAALVMDRKLMREVVSIVRRDTILARQSRLRKRKRDYWGGRVRHPRRPRSKNLACKVAGGAQGGHKRISGELRKLGIQVSKTCVADILRYSGLPPSPERGGLSC